VHVWRALCGTFGLRLGYSRVQYDDSLCIMAHSTSNPDESCQANVDQRAYLAFIMSRCVVLDSGAMPVLCRPSRFALCQWLLVSPRGFSYSEAIILVVAHSLNDKP